MEFIKILPKQEYITTYELDENYFSTCCFNPSNGEAVYFGITEDSIWPMSEIYYNENYAESGGNR